MNAREHGARRTIKGFFLDSTHWDDVIPRHDDIIIASCYKAGTTLTQQIVNLLLHGSDHNVESMRAMSPWMDSGRFIPDPAEIEALPSPRFLKSHLPFDALPYRQEWRYIYLGRDPRDVGLSLFNHCQLMEAELAAAGRAGTVDNGPDDFSSFWDLWVETGKPRWDFWDNVDSWWTARRLPNVLFVHYSDLIERKVVECERIARFIGRPWDAATRDMVLEYSSLQTMKKLEEAGKFGPEVKAKTSHSRVNKGTNGRWRELLTHEQLERLQAILARRLDAACVEWLLHGGHIE